MRILHIDKFMGGGGGTSLYLQHLSEMQRRRGHEVYRFGCVEGGSDEFPQFRDFTSAAGPSAVLAMIHNCDAAAKLEAWIARRPVDVAHLHNIYHHLTPSILPVLARRRVAIVMTLHDYRLVCPTKHLYRSDGLCRRCVPNRLYHAAGRRCAGLPGGAAALETLVQRAGRRYFRWVDFFTCPTQYMRSIMVEAHLPASKAVVVPHPVVLAHFEPAPSEADAYILFAGRLSQEKGPQLMLDLAERLDGVRVVIAGAGPLGDELSGQIRRRRLQNVELTGWVDHESMPGYYTRAAAVVLTSRCMENSPLTMLEAMAAGRCVVVPDQPPLGEWVRDGRTGRTYPTGDVDRLIEVVRQVLADPSGAARMGQAGRALIAGRHDPQVVVDQIDELYTEAIRRCELRW